MIPANSIGYATEVQESVRREYKSVVDEITKTLTPKQIFDTASKNLFIQEVTYQLMDEGCSEQIYKALYQERGNILRNLCRTFDFYPGVVGTPEEAQDYLRRYCNTFHQDIMEEGGNKLTIGEMT